MEQKGAACKPPGGRANLSDQHGQTTVKWRSIIGLAAGLSLAAPVCAEEPWSVSDAAPAPAAAAPRPAAGAPLPPGYGQICGHACLKAYQNGFSRMMSSKCPMWPSCSAYSLDAIGKYGFVRGALLTADRLYHEGSIQRTARRIQVGDQLRYWDPVEDNVVWKEKP